MSATEQKPSAGVAPAERHTRGGGHRERLLAAAVECLRERGYARTTARDLVAASGTNLASIGYHFGSKEALLNEAIAEGFRAWTAEVVRAVDAVPDDELPARIGASLAATVGNFEELRPFLIAFAEALPHAARVPELRETLAEAYDEVRVATTRMVEEALASEGVEVGAAEQRTLASILIAVCDGLMVQWLVDPERTPTVEEIGAMVGAFGQTSPGRTR